MFNPGGVPACCRLLAILLCFSATLRAGEPVRLTTDGKLKFSPVFGADAKEIVYAVLEKPEQYRLMRLTLATGKVEMVHKAATTSEFEPTFSADGRTFAYLKLRGILSVGLVIRGAAEAEVKPPDGFAGLRTPAVSPDGSRVLFSSAEGGRQQLYVVDAQGKDRKALTDSGGINNAPCFSPDGKKIVFSSTRDGNYEIYDMNADGSNVRRLTRSPYQDLRPRYSPDGKRIAFTSHRDGNAEIYVANADGSELRRLTRHSERDDYPCWHPDGKRLVHVAERDGRHDLVLLAVDD